MENLHGNFLELLIGHEYLHTEPRSDKATLLCFAWSLNCPNFRTASKRIIQSHLLCVAPTTTLTTRADKLLICVSQHQALFHRRDANYLKENIRLMKDS